MNHLLSRLKDTPTGFVPTMGALHEGHLELIRRSRQEGGVTVCSIFINPTQFNNPEDLQRYPVTLEKDVLALEQSGCDYLFLPSVEEIYPPGYAAPHYDLGHLEGVLEGAHRPGHFQGVCQVVDRLLQIVEPDRLYLGEKDWQQCMVLARLLQTTGRGLQLVTVPTVRERDGLAMSSRNLRLSPEHRFLAPLLYRSLQAVAAEGGAESAVQSEKEQLERAGFEVDYLEVRAASDLQPLPVGLQNGSRKMALVAASIGGVRLIDNLLLP